MTVLLVNKFHYLKGGAERYYLDLGDFLSAGGDSVVHLSMRHPSNRPAGPEDVFVSEVDYRARLGLAERIGHGLRSIYNREASRLAHEVVRRSRPDVAHLHNVYHQLSPSVIRALDSDGVPIVQTIHDYKLVCPAYLLLVDGQVCERCKGGRFHEAYRHRCLLESRAASAVGMVEAYLHRWMRTYEKVRLFLCPSRFIEEKLAAFGIRRERLEHLPYFLPIDRYAPAAATEGYYVYAGRLSREKGIGTLLEAHARLPRGRLPLRILGEGPMRESLEIRRVELGLDDVTFEGFQQAEQLKRIVAASLFVTVPSEWYENYPYAILETFALGRPVLGTRIGGIPELVRDGETGLTAPAGDPAALAEGLAAMMALPSRAHEMGRAARAWVGANLAPEAHLERLRAIYERVGR
ncbi:MAG: glycosyltransferase [Candidatus Eisenbacteria bacterium]|nr:glycosyltransferase [Candidatus Eisenbacteria bacterium]